MDPRKFLLGLGKVVPLEGETQEQFMANRFIAGSRADGLVFSTVRVPDSDDGWDFETAIIDANRTIPVERYQTKEEAKAGHERWVEIAFSLKTVICLSIGWAGAMGHQPEEYTLVRRKNG